jgi:hypothetical protein
MRACSAFFAGAVLVGGCATSAESRPDASAGGASDGASCGDDSGSTTACSLPVSAYGADAGEVQCPPDWPTALTAPPCLRGYDTKVASCGSTNILAIMGTDFDALACFYDAAGNQLVAVGSAYPTGIGCSFGPPCFTWPSCADFRFVECADAGTLFGDGGATDP